MKKKFKTKLTIFQMKTGVENAALEDVNRQST